MDQFNNEPLDIEAEFTEREQQLFWMVLDTQKRITEIQLALEKVLGASDMNMLDDDMLYDDLFDLLGYDSENDIMGDWLFEYRRGNLTKEEFIENVRCTPRKVPPARLVWAGDEHE